MVDVEEDTASAGDLKVQWEVMLEVVSTHEGFEEIDVEYESLAVE